VDDLKSASRWLAALGWLVLKGMQPRSPTWPGPRLPSPRG